MSKVVPCLLLAAFLLPAPFYFAEAQRPSGGSAGGLTPAEAADFEATPSYQETIAYLEKLRTDLPEMHLGFFGSSGEGRPMPFVVVSKEKAFTAERARQTGKPVVLIQSGIHGGEVDGKDATLMILRDMARGGHRDLIDKLTLVLVPIYNVDGHERMSPYNRPNQDGPRQGMGFRTTTQGFDLNRDHVKLASDEARALINLVDTWRPHLHIDNHVTDGVDHDWVLTWTWAEAPQIAAPVDSWLRRHMPAVLAATEKAGHRNGPYVDLKDRGDLKKGFSSWVGQPRFSSGFFPLLNRPSILVETHSYKPYKQRVLATRDFNLAVLDEIAKDPAGLTQAVADAEAATVAMGKPDAPPSEVVVSWQESDEADPIRFPVYATETKQSVVSGQPLVRYRRGQVAEIEVPWYHRSEPARTLPRPRGYLVMPGWPQIEQRLRWHGLVVEKLDKPAEIEVETQRVSNPSHASSPYQGMFRIDRADVKRQTEKRHIPAGALWIPADQPDFELAVQLLEPEAPDSLFAWGYLSNVFESKEYIDAGVLEDQVAKLLEDPATAKAWQEALKDEKLAADPFGRYLWWYRRTPHWDETLGLLPYFRVMQTPKLETRSWP